MDGALPNGDLLGPISPELVLVDPVLREAALARLEVREPLDGRPLRPVARQLPVPPAAAPAPRPPLPRPVEAPVVREHSRRRIAARLVPAIVPLTLVFGVLVAMAASEMRDQSPSFVAPTTNARATTPQPKPTATTRRSRPRTRTRTARRLLGSRSDAERAVLLAVVQAPRGKLPAALIDRATGLAKNGLQARCRRSGRASFRCVVETQRRPELPRLRVTYRIGADGRGVYAWGATAR